MHQENLSKLEEAIPIHFEMAHAHESQRDPLQTRVLSSLVSCLTYRFGLMDQVCGIHFQQGASYDLE